MATWIGQTTETGLAARYVEFRRRLSQATRAGAWDDMFAAFESWPGNPNLWHLDDTSLRTPLHEAARQGAPLSVVEELIRMGAWRSLRDSTGTRPVDAATTNGHETLVDALRPRPLRPHALEPLEAFERHVHEVVRERAGALVEKFAIRLPALVVLRELEPAKLTLPIPRMLGAFYMELDHTGEMLEVKSWSRAVMGSGRRWHVRRDGAELVERGFV